MNIFIFACLFLPALLNASDVLVLGQKLQEGTTKSTLNFVELSRIDIQEQGIETVRDLADSSANFQVIGSSSSRYITPYIRGQGNQDLNLPDDISVMFYLDEIPLPRYAFETELFDLQSIQILRGPQGTLFGKNTQAGAILLNTMSPADQLAGSELSLGVGNYDQARVRLKSNWGLGSKFKARTAFLFKDQSGWLEDKVLNRDLGARQTQATQNSFLFTPKEGHLLSLNLGAQREKGDDPFFVARNIGTTPVSGQDKLPFYERDLITSSLKYNWKMDDRTDLTAIAAFSYYDFEVSYDEADQFVSRSRLTNLLGAATANSLVNNPNVLYRDIKEYDRQNFSELRLRRQFNDQTTLTAGLTFAVGHYRIVTLVNTFAGSSLTNIFQNIKLKSTSTSAFSELEHSFSSKWSTSFGIRLNSDQKEFESQHTSSAIPLYLQQSKTRFDDLTARVGIIRQWDQIQKTYFTLARGYQPGGYPSFQLNNFRGLSRDQEAFDKSTSTNYEIGHKISSKEHGFDLQSALFFNDVKARQIRIRDLVTNNSRYQNVNSEIFGAEIEAKKAINDLLSVGGSAGYTNSRFKETVLSSGEVALKENDRTANVPYINSSVFSAFSYYFNSIESLFSSRLTYAYTGSRFGENRNLTRLPSFGLWNLKLGLESEKWSVDVRINNLFNKTYDSQAFYFTTFVQEVTSPGLPRMATLDLTYRF